MSVMLDEIKVQFHTTRRSNTPFSTSDIKMGLIIDPGTPLVRTMVLADLQALAPVFSGYAEASLTTWTVPTLTADGHARMTSNTSATFTNSGGSDSEAIYGWFLYDSNTGKAIICDLFITPIVLSAGLSYTSVPFYTLTGES